MSFGILTRELLGVDLNHSGTSLSVQWLSKTSHLQCRRHGFDPWLGKILHVMWHDQTKTKQDKHCKSAMCAC